MSNFDEMVQADLAKVSQSNGQPIDKKEPQVALAPSFDDMVQSDLNAEKPKEPEEPDYIARFRSAGPNEADDVSQISLNLLSPEERSDALKVHPWIYKKMTPEQQEEQFQLSRKSHPFSAGELVNGIGSIIGTGFDLAKSAAELGLDIADVRVAAPIRQAIENKSWFEVKGRNQQIQKAQEKLDKDARNLAGSVPSGIINSARTVQKIFGGKDLNGISNNIQRSIATAAPVIGQQLGVPIGVTQNIVGLPMPAQQGEKPNPWSFVPTTGVLPFDLVTKLAESTYNKDVGGFASLDRLNESLGLSDEEQSRNHDNIRRLYDAEIGVEDWKASVGEKKLSPWSQVAFSDIGQQAILLREKSMLPSAQFIADLDGISIEEADAKRDRIAEQNAEKATLELTKTWNKEYDPSMEFLGSLFIGDAGFGEAGLALGAGKLSAPLIEKAKTLGMSNREVSAYYEAMQKLQKAKDIARQKKMSQPSWWGKTAGYVEQKQKDLSAAGQSLFEKLPEPVQAAAPIAGKIATKLGIGGVGGGVGALLDPENPTAGLLEGVALTTALGVAPSVVRSIDAARRTIGAGEGKLFTQVAKSPESSLPARVIFNKATGPLIDYVVNNGITLAKAGVNLGALSAVTSTLNSDDPEEFNRAIAEGFGMGMGFHLAHGVAGKIHGKNPAQEIQDRKKRDVEIYEAVKTASPATQGVLEQVTNYQTAIDRVDAFVARSESNLAEAIAKEDPKWIEMATTALKNARALQGEVLRANVQTRNEYGRSFLSTYADMNRLANGTRRAGQPNISIEILTPEQIADLHVSENSRQGMTPEEIMAVRLQGEQYAMERGFFDRAKNRAVINAAHILARTTLFGESPSDALRHEGSHALGEIPEFKKLNEKTDKLLFTNEEKDLQGNVLKRTVGIYDDNDLVEMYLKKYIGDRNTEEKIRFSEQLGLWDRNAKSLNVPAVVKYMKDEVRAELTAGSLRSGLGSLMGAEATVANWISMRQKQSFLARAIQSVTGIGSKPFSSELLDIEYTPEVIAANKEAIKALAEFNGRFEANPESFSGREMSEKEIRTNPVLRKRYGLSGGEFQTELKGVIRDANGKIVGKPISIVNPLAAEGNWSFDAEGNRKQTRGYGQVPDEFQGVQIPAGGTLEVYRDFVYEPDGKTPVRTKPSDLAKLEKDRGDLIRQALTDAPYDDSTTRLTPFSADGLSWSGIMSKSQIQAIKDIPESILPLSIKEKIFAFNDAMARGDGSTFDIDYAPRLGIGRAYKGRKSDIYHIIPIGFGFSKAGNFYLRTLSLNAAFRKLKARAKLMQGWLEPWDNDPNLFMKEFQETYLINTYEKRDGWLGLDPENPTQKTPLAEVKFGRFLDFMNMIGSETPPNPQRAATPADPSARRGKKAKLGAEEDNQGIDNLWRSHRLDAIADIADTTEVTGRYRMDLDRVYKALMPSPAAEPAPEAPMEERRPSAINLGISATYTAERRPFEARYVAPEGAALTASLVSSGTSLESFGKESLAKLAEYYGITIPEGASRGEIIDSINEREPVETKFTFTTSTKRDAAIKKLINAKDDQGIRDLNRTTILHVLSDLKHIPVTIEDTKGVYMDEKEISSIIKVATDNKQDLNRVRSRIADAAKMFQQQEFLEEKLGGGQRSLLGEFDEEGYKHIGSATLFVEGATEAQIEEARKSAGIDGLTLADGRVDLYDRGNDQEFFNRVAAFNTAIRQAGGVVTSSETGVAAVKSYSEDPQRYAETIGYDDQSLRLYSEAGESERLKTPLVQRLIGLMGRPMEAPTAGKRSYFEAKDLTPEQVKKQAEIAQIFTGLPLNDLANPLVQKAYERLNVEIGKQYDYLTEGEDGTKFTSQPYDLSGEPYESSVDAINDIRTKNSLKFLKTDPSSFGPEGEDFSYHPLLQDSGRVDANGVKLTYNDLFRAVHDAIAHGLFGVEFGPVGEESAWQTHMRTLDDPWARWALTTETRGQNSYVNYREQMLGQDGMPFKKGDEGYIPLKKRGFAEQKAALLPLEYSLTGDKKVDEATRKLMNEIGEEQSQGSAGISFMPRIDVVPERMQGTGDEPVTSNADWKKTKVLPAGGRRGKYVSPPPNFKKYDISDFTMGGKMFDKDTGEDVTDRIYSSASIDATGKRPALASSDEQPSDLGKGNQYKTNLFKKSAGWEWISDNPPEHSSLPSDGTEDPVLISVQGTFPDKGADHRYALKVNFDSPVKMARYSNEPNEPRLRPTAKGVIQYGNVIGQMRTSQGKVHNVYDTITIGEKPVSDVSFMPAAKLDEAHAKAIESGDMEENRPVYTEKTKYHQIIPEVTLIDPSRLLVRDADEVRSVPKEVANNMDFSEPVQASVFANGEVRLFDGHHRRAAAIKIGRPSIPVELQAINAYGGDINKLIKESQSFANPSTTLKPASDIAFMPSEKEKKTLTAVHNLSEENLRNVLKVGGLAVPSVAVIRNDRSDFTSFGEITLVAPYSMVDPKKDSKSKVFNADVYSPRYPRIDYSMPDKKANRNLIDSIKESINKIPEDIRKRFFVSFETDQADRPMRERFSEDPIFMAGFLADTNRIGDVKFGTPEEERYADQSARWNIREFMRENPDLKEEFNNWIENKLDETGVTEEEKLFAGYTPSGTRRYVPHTLDNVVKMMAKSLRDGEGPNYGVGSVRSKAAKQFRTLKQVQDAREQIVSKDRMEELKAEVNDEFDALAQESIKLRNVQRDFYFDNIADDMKALAEGGSENMNYLKEQYPNGAPFEKWRDYLDKLRNLPTEYFEAKIQRGVGLDEFAGAVVPKETSQDVIESLEKRGLQVIKYDERNEGSRAQAIRDIGAKRSDISFMPAAKLDETYAKAIESGDMEQAQRLVDERAKAKGLPIVTLWRGFRKKPNPEQLRTTAGRATTSYTPVEEVAKLYSHDPSTLKQGKGASVKKIYLDIKNPLDLREEGTKVSLGDIIENHTKWDLTGSDKPSGLDATDIVDILDELTLLHGKTNFEYEIDHSDDGFFKMQDFDDLKEYIEERANRIEEAAKKGEEDENAASEIFYALNDTTLDAFAIGDSSELVYALQKNGYDGIIHKDTIEAGKNYFTKESVAGRPIEEVEGIDVDDDYSHDTYRPFNQNQIKSADPATYDNEGKLIPLSQRFDTSKPDIRFMPAAKLDEAHAKAIESGDMEQAQRMVDERARQAGYTIGPVYHGTNVDPAELTIPSGDRGVASHVSFNKKVAKQFAENAASDYGDEPQIHKWLIKGDIFDPTNPEHLARLKNVIGENIDELRPVDKIPTHADFSTFESTKLQDALKQAGFDGYYDRENTKFKWHENLAIFDPSNIKSADPATYDDNGKLIPLSQRFDTSKPDIRFMPYSPELPKTEDGKVDWKGFKTKTQEIAKPLAALAPIGGISFMGKKEKSPMPMSALNVLHSDSDVLPKPDKKVANAKVAVQLADIAEQHHGRVITSNDITLEEEQKFIQNGADEAEAALKASGKNAGNWYSTAMKAAVAIAGVLHKVISDPKEAMKNPHFAKEPDPTKAAQFAFLIPLAITSQNQTVPLNTRYGEEQFNHFQKTGKFDPTKIYGEKAASISGNLELANHLIDVMGGLTKLEDFVKQEFSVKELEDAASKIAGRKITIAGRKTDMVNGAAIFGPKIGQGFLQNLMGKFDPVTIDLWMRRTWGRWTGDVVGDGVTGVRLGRLIQEYRNSGRRLPDSLKNLRTVMRSTGTTSTGKPTKPELTVSGNVQDRIETDPEFRKSIEQLSKEANAEFQGYYKLMGSPVSDAMILEINKVAPVGKIKYSEETRNERDFAYNKLIKEQLKIKNDLDEKWDQLSPVEKKSLNAEDPKKAISKAKWIEQQHANAGRTKVLANEQKNAIKPQWASAAKSIVADLNPIDIPTDQDRVVISRVVNGIRKTLESRGYNVTNADVQAILWYPEKDLWAKLRGEEESNLKQSYDDELLKIAEQRGVGAEARAIAKRIRGY